MKALLSFCLLIAGLSLTAQTDKGMRYHQLKKLPPGRIIVGNGTTNVDTVLTGSIVAFTPTGNTSSSNMQAAVVELQTEIDQLVANGGADGNNFVTAANVTGTTTKTLAISRDGLADVTADFTDQVDDADADATNELQYLSKFSVNGQVGFRMRNADGTLGANFRLDGLNGLDVRHKSGSVDDAVSLEIDASGLDVNDADADPANEIQDLTKVGNKISLTGSGIEITDEVNDADADATNEIQNLGTSSLNDLTLSAGGGTQSRADQISAGKFVATGGESSFVLAFTPVAGQTLLIDRNGMLQSIGAGEDLTVTATSVTINGFPAEAGEEFKYWVAQQ